MTSKPTKRWLSFRITNDSARSSEFPRGERLEIFNAKVLVATETIWRPPKAKSVIGNTTPRATGLLTHSIALSSVSVVAAIWKPSTQKRRSGGAHGRA
jgi:hypothetical protein